MRYCADPGPTKVPPAVFEAYRGLVPQLGTPRLHEALDDAIRDLAPVRRWYFYRHDSGCGGAPSKSLACRHEPDLEGMVEAYLERFRFSDPLSRVLEDGRHASFVLGLRPADIPDAVYRERYLQEARIQERLSLVHRDAQGWCVASFARCVNDGEFDQEVIDSFRAMSELVFPLLERHPQLAGSAVGAGPCLDLAAVRSTLRQRCKALSERETEVCAQLAIGLPAKTIARDLGIGVETVQTYRKRAYQRLAITRARQLTELLLA